MFFGGQLYIWSLYWGVFFFFIVIKKYVKFAISVILVFSSVVLITLMLSWNSFLELLILQIWNSATIKLKNNYYLLFPPVPGSHSSVFCFYEVGYARYLKLMGKHSIGPFVTGLFQSGLFKSV